MYSLRKLIKLIIENDPRVASQLLSLDNDDKTSQNKCDHQRNETCDHCVDELDEFSSVGGGAMAAGPLTITIMDKKQNKK